MKKLHLFIVMMLLTCTGAFAQKASITGLVIDSNSKESIPFATVAIMKADSDKAIAGTVSSDEGSFSIDKLNKGVYDIWVSFIGYETQVIKSISVDSKQSKKLDSVVELKEKNISLGSIEVKANARTVMKKIDRQSYRVDDFETAKGGTAVDLLNKLPSVSVDGDGAVSVRGTTDFVVYLNGKPTQMDASTLLSQIPSDNIDNVDIITVPTSKYEAHGKGGIVNITTKRSVNSGLSVTANVMGGGTPWSNTDDVLSGQSLSNNRYNAGINLSYNKDRLSLYGSVNYNSKDSKGVGIIDPYIYQGEGQPQEGNYYIFDGNGERPKWYSNLMATFGLNYELNDRSSLSTSYQYSKMKNGRAAHYVYDAYFASTPTTPIEGAIPGTTEHIYNPNDINREGSFNSFALDYNLRLNETSVFDAGFLLEKSTLDQVIDNKEYAYDEARYYFNDTPQFHSLQQDKTPLDAYRITLDYEKEFDNGNRLSSGIHSQFVRLDGSFEYEEIVPSDKTSDEFSEPGYFDNAIDLKRDIYAGYIDYAGTAGKLNYIVGVRMEYMNQLMEVESTNYFEDVYDYFGEDRDYSETDFEQKQFDFFPTVHMQYNANEANSLIFAASRRINRPAAKDMAPFLYRRHQEIFEMGDPLLEPEYIVSGELSYNRKLGNNNIVLTGFYRQTNNAIYRVNRVSYDLANTGGVLLRSHTNAGNQKAMGGELGVNLSLASNLKWYIGGALYDFRVDANDELSGVPQESQSTNWNLKTNLGWNITDPLKLTLDYSIKSGSVTPQGESDEFQMLNVALNYTPKTLAGWTFSAKVLDVLETNQQGGYTTAYDANNQQIFNRKYIYDYEGMIVELGASFTFNAKKSKKKSHESIGKDYF